MECRDVYKNHALKIINEGGQKLSYTQDFFTIQGGDKSAGEGGLVLHSLGEGGLPLVRNFHGFAFFPPAWEVPGIGEAAALVGFGFLDGAGVGSFKENAGTVLAFLEGKAFSGGSEAGVFLDKFQLANFQKLRDGGDVRLGQSHQARPSAAIPAAHALVSWLFHVWAGTVISVPAQLRQRSSKTPPWDHLPR